MIDLPLNGRQATQLILLAGGAQVPPDANRTVTTHNYPTATGVSVAGGQVNGNNYLLDGADNNDSESNVNLPYPFPDALQEFSVQTNGVSARYGLHPGSVMNVITKSGSNQFHGDLFEFLRNGAFDARNFFAPSSDTLRRNQFGGTIGGPIKKDKLFFFFGYQGTRTRTAPPQLIDFTPTAAALSGDFSTLESSACQSSGKARTILNPATGQPFANDFVSPTLFSSQATALLKYVPISTNPCGQLTYAISTQTNEDQYIGRVDWAQSAKNSLFARYFLTNYDLPTFFNGTNILTTTQSAFSERPQSFVLSDSYSISPTTLNSVHAAWSRLRINRSVAPNLISPNQVGVNMCNFTPHFIYLSVSNHFAMGGGNNAPADFNRNQTQLADDVDMIRGHNQIIFGGEWIHMQFNENNIYLGNGQFTFNGQLTNDPLLDYMLGLPNFVTQANPEVEAFRQNYFGMYVQDNLQLNKGLNLHVGMRWEPLLPEKDAAGRGSHFSLTAFNAGTKTSQYVNAPPGLLFNGDPGIPASYAYSSLADFAPRLGFAWDPTGSGKQTVRSSYGIFYDTPLVYLNALAADAPPWGNEIGLTAPTGGLGNPYAGVAGGNPFPTPYPPTKNETFNPEGVYVNLPLNLHHSYMQQWDLSYQRQFGNNWLLSATYLGNKATHLWTSTEQDPAVYIPGSCAGKPCSTVANTNSRRVLYLANPAAGSFFSTITLLDDGDNSNYNALMLSLQHRFSNNFTLLSNYTYSHCLQDSQVIGDKLAGNAYQNPYNRNANYGNCDFDLRHNFNTSLVFESPRLKNRLTNALLGNWQIAPLFSAHSGFWLSPVTGVDNSLTGVGSDRPNLIGNPYIKNTATRAWINPAAFVPNPLGTFGNAGADSLVGPGYFDIDTDVSRFFNIRESQRLELRFEFFNALNNVNFNNPDNNLHSPIFGTILSAGDPRILQFALKYYF